MDMVISMVIGLHRISCNFRSGDKDGESVIVNIVELLQSLYALFSCFVLTVVDCRCFTALEVKNL